MATAARGQFHENVVLITGGGSGIGRGIALAFAVEGATVMVTGRRKEPLDETVNLIVKAGGKAASICGDVTKPDDCHNMVFECVVRFGRLDILVNNAGIARYGALDQTQDEDIANLIDINLLGTALMTKYAIPELVKHAAAGTASILNIGTSAATSPVKHFAVYTAAKAAVIHLTLCMALELAENRVRVNCINPGVVETPIFSTMMPAAAVKHAMSNFAKQTPLGRVGDPRDVSEAALFLCSRKAGWITGAVLNVDGGISLT